MAKKNKKRPRKRKRLTADPKRQTNDSLRGYRYQILHSVNAWLNLAEDETLYLEGVEDFDVVSDNAATLVQVKDTQHNVTLRSREVNDAINHYWESQAKYPELTIKFRFITRSKIGKEQNNWFGKGQPGLHLWNRCSGDEQTITKISKFLRTEEKISNEVKGFLEQAEPQEIYEQLIEPITWETGNAHADFVKKYISDKLVNHGTKLGFLPSDVSKVLNALLNEAFAIATHKENRELTKARFFEIFEAETTQRVPTQYLRYLQRQATLAAALDTDSMALVGDASDITIQLHSPIQTVIPPLYPNVAPRTDLLTSIQTKLQSDNIVIIHGGVDKGKTTLAKLAANAVGGSWRWLNLRGKDSSEVTQLLQQLDAQINHQSSQINVVLDDLNLQPQQLQAYEEILGMVVYSVQMCGVKLLITSQHKPPNNFIRSLGLSSSAIIDKLDFTMPEIEQFAKKMACPTDDIETWVTLIQAHTGGHPRLVHALLTQLREREWKQQDIIESILQTPSEVLKERDSARQLLMSLPEDRREFLYRLSLLIIEFRKDYAINIGEIPVPIPRSGDIFSQLVGPWIDQVNETYYTVSPLLKNAAREVWSESKITDLHAQIANSILKTKNLTTTEAWAVFTHSVAGQYKKGIIAFIYSLMNAPQNDWKNLCQEFSWLVHIKIGSQGELFPGDAFINQMFRSLQYKIAVEIKPELVPKIFEIWDKETKPYEPSQLYLLSRLMLATEILRYHQAPFPVKKLIGYLKEMVNIKDSDKEVWTIFYNSMGQLEGYKTDKSNYFSILFGFIYARRPMYAPFLSELIDALDELQPEIRGMLLADFEDETIDSRILIDGIWGAEVDLESPDWARCLHVFDKVIEKTIAWGYPHFAAAAARGKAMIYDECLDEPEPDTAHKILQDFVSKVGPSPIVEEEQAVIYLHQKRYKEGLNIYERILPEWDSPSGALDVMPSEGCRRAAICAANLGDWKKAATFLEEGVKRTQKSEDTERHISFCADAGFAQFKVGNMLDCIRLLNLALRKFEMLSQDNTDVGYFTLKKRLACSIGWIAYHENENYTSKSEEPPVGFCSNPETNQEVLNLSDSRIEHIWLALARIEYKFGHETTVLKHALQITNQNTNPRLSNALCLLEAQWDFKNKTFDDLPQRIHQLAKASDWKQEHNQSEKGVQVKGTGSLSIVDLPNLASVRSIITILVSALLAQLSINRDVREILAIWRTNSLGLPIKDNMTIALDLIESVLLGDQSNALTVMKTQESKPEECLAAALKIIHNTETSSENLFHAHALIAPYLVSSLIWLDSFETGLAELLSLQWLEKIKFRATLKTPMITVPRIEQTCNSSETGKKKIGQILLAVHQAVSLRVDPETLQQFRDWAESESEQKQESTSKKNPTAQRLIEAMEKPPHLTDEDVEALNQSIEEGKMLIKFDSPFESDEREKE